MKKLFSAVLASLLILSSFTFTFAANASEGDTSVVLGTNSIKGVLSTSGIKAAIKTEVLTGENAVDGYECVKINPDPCTDRQPPVYNGENLVILENSLSGYDIDTSKYHWVRVMYKYVPAADDTTAYTPYFTFRSDGSYSSGNITAPNAYVANEWAYMDFDISSLAETEPGTLQYYRFFSFGGYAGTQMYSGAAGNTTADTWKTDTSKKLANPNSTLYIASMTFFTQEEQPGLPTVTGISFAEDSVEIEKGYSYPMPVVTVSGENGHNTNYNIVMAGYSSANTKLVDGTIVVGEDETASSFTITVTAVGDATKSAVLTVNVKNPAPRTPFDENNVVMRFGVVSDVHQNGYYAGKISNPQAQEWSHVIDVFQKTAAADGAVLDAILVNGDLTDGVANGGSNVGSFTTYGDKALQNMRETGFFAHGVWGADNGIEFTETKKVSDETKASPNSYKEATSVYGHGNGFDDTTKLFYVLGNHDESGRGVSNAKAAGNTIDGQTLKFSDVYSADYFGAILCGWQHNPDSEEAVANSIGGTGSYQDGFEHSYRGYFADLIDYNTNAATTVTEDSFAEKYGVKLSSADALFDKYYGHLDVETTLTDTENGIRFGNSHMTIDPNPDNDTTTDRIHFIGIELSMSAESNAWAEEIIKTSVAEDPTKPVFIITHYKLKGTMLGDTNYTSLANILKNYPQAIIWGGHSHTTMHTDNAINTEQGYVAVETNTTRYMSTSSSLTLSSKFGAATSNNEKYPSTPFNYPSHEAAVSNGCYVEVDANNNVRINRVDMYRSFSTDFAANPTLFSQSKYTNFNSHAYNPDFKAVDKVVYIREPWDITDIGTGKHLADYNTTVRTEKTAKPYFEDASSVTAESVIGGLNVTIKLNAKDDDGMVMLYVLEIKDKDGNVAHRRYYTNFFYEFPQSDSTLAGNDIAVRTESASITGLNPATEYTVSLFAVDEYYVAGEAISTTVTTKDGDTKLTLEDGRIAVFVDTTGASSTYKWTDGKEYLVYNSFPDAIATGADVIYVIKSTHVSNSLRDSVVGKQTKDLEIIGLAEDRADAVLSWANAVYFANYDLTLTNIGLNKEVTGDCALHVYNGHTLTINSCLVTGNDLNIFTARSNNSITGNLIITGDTGNIGNIWTNSTYSLTNTSVTGDVTLTLAGGTYTGNVHFMKLNSTDTDPYNRLDGNLYINVSGGTFQKALRGSTPDKRAIITKNSVVNVTGGTIAQLGNTGTSYVQGKEVYIITDAVLATTTYTTSKDTSGNAKSILITVPANEGGIGEATVDETTGYITAYAVKQVEGKASFVNGVAATSIMLEDGQNYVVTYKTANAVEFNLNGGEGTAPETYVGTTNEVYTNLPDGTGIARKNYDFLGWALTADATEAVTSVTIPAEGVILYAVWQAKPHATITLNGNGGTVNGDESVIAFAGEETTLPTAYKAKAVFIGWAESADAETGSLTYTTTGETEAVTLYAVYKEIGTDVIYVDTTAKENGDGRTSASPMNDWIKAMAAGSADGTMYVLMTSTIVSHGDTVGVGYNSAKGALWLTNIDPATGAKYDSAAVLKKNGHYTTKAVTYDMPIASLERTGMHINFCGNDGRFTENASFIAKDAAIPGMTDTCSSVPFLRGGSDSGDKNYTSITFDNLDFAKNVTVYVGNEFSDTVTNANIIINDGTVSKTFNMNSGLATIANVVINGYSATASISIDKPASCTTLNYILNNDTANLVTVPTGENIYVVKSTAEGTVEPTETAGTFKITTEEDNIYVNGTPVTKNADNLYALGNAGTYEITYDQTPRHTVTYKANGGEGADVIKTVKEGAEIDLTAEAVTFTKAGYTLLGWNTDANAATALEALTMGTADVTLYAVWAEKTHKVTYDMNGGEGDAPAEVYVRETAEIALPTEVGFSLLGFEFLGWNTDKDATAALTSLTMGEADVTLYAIWKEKVHTVTYDMNGGEGTAPESVTVREGLAVTIPTEVEFTKAGHTFKGWAQTADAESVLETLTMGTADITLYAIWEKETYTVTFNANGGKSVGELANAVKVYGEDLTLPTDYVLYGTGLEFVGWSTNPDAAADEVLATYAENAAADFFAIYNKVGTANVTPGTNDDELATGTYFVIKDSEEEIEAPEFDIPGTATEIRKVDITLVDAATKAAVQPASPVTFTIHCDEGALSGKAVYVYHVGTDNEIIQSSVNGDDVTFTTDSLSTFVIYTVEPDATYITKGQYNNVTGLYTVSLYYNGEAANSGSFGFAYDSTVYTFDAFTYAEGIDEVIKTGHDAENAVVTGTWYPTIGAYVGGTDEDVLIGTFTFTCDIADYDMTKSAERFYEYNETTEAIDEIYNGEYYLYAPNVDSSLEVTFAPIVTLDVIDAEPITVTYTVSGKLVTVREDGKDPNYFAKAIVTTENKTTVDEFDIESSTTNTGTVEFEFDMAPGTYNITVVKNGYLEKTITFTVTDEDLDIGDIVPVPGDIRGNASDAQGDGVIDLADFVRVLRGFEYPDVASHVDINEDGISNVTDLGYVSTNFNKVK